jgi:hypothetical protein
MVAHFYNLIFLGGLRFKASLGKRISETPIITNKLSRGYMPIIPAM